MLGQVRPQREDGLRRVVGCAGPGEPARSQPSRGVGAILTTSLLLWASGASAQEASPLPPLGAWAVEVYDTEDVAALGTLNGVVAARSGLLYLGGSRGLARHDGHRLTPVTIPGAPSRFVAEVLEDPHGRIWVAYLGGGVSLIDGDVIRSGQSRYRLRNMQFDPVADVARYRSVDGIYEFRVDGDSLTLSRPIVTDEPGTQERHLRLPDGTPALIQPTRVLTAAGETDIGLAEHCMRYLGAGVDALGPLLSCFDHDSARVMIRPTTEGAQVFKPRTAADVVDPYAWLSDAGTAFRTEPGYTIDVSGGAAAAGTATDTIPIRAMLGEDDARWLILRDPETRRDHLFRTADDHREQIPLRRAGDFRVILYIAADGRGGVWVATDAQLFHVVPRSVARIESPPAGLASGVTALLELQDSSVLVGTWGGGLHHFDDGTLVRRHGADTSLGSNMVRALHQTPDGVVWVGTDRGLARLSPDGTVLDRRTMAEVRGFAPSDDGSLTLASQAGIVSYQAGEYRDVPGFDDLDIWAAAHVAGDLWVGGAEGLRRTRSGRVEPVPVPGVVDPFVVAFFRDPAGRHWIGTYENGAFVLTDDGPRSLPSGAGLGDVGVWHMLWVDESVWISTSRGVLRAPADSLASLMASTSDTHTAGHSLTFERYGTASGTMSIRPQRASPAAVHLTDGRLLFNGAPGPSVIDPGRFGDVSPPEPIVSSVRADGEEVERGPDGSARVPAGARRVSLEFSALAFDGPTEPLYRYRLTGLDDDWYLAGPDPEAVFTGLGPGRYAFTVQAHHAGAWSPSSKPLPFTVAPTLAQSGPFRLFVLAAALAVAYLLHRVRVRQVLKIQQLREGMVRDLHDDLGASLGAVRLLSAQVEKMLDPTSPASERARQLSSMAASTSTTLRDAIWVADPAHDDVGALASKLREVAEDLLPGIEKEFHMNVPAPQARVHPGDARTIVLAAKEMLHNLARHAEASRATVEVRADVDRFELRVTDDGVGLSDTRPEGYGLASLRTRATEGGGRFEVSSCVGGGTAAVFSLPLRDV